jgi:pyridinium-3,5-bisthiocarboxylic acid mononucleotide nickel chelatase
VAATFERPAMSLAKIGYGIGTKDVPNNGLAVWIGELAETETGVTVIDTNLDDMAPNLIGALTEDLMSAGALDVSVTSTVMKKGRPGHLITVIAPLERVALLTDHLLRHSTTLGVRLTDARRVIAHRRIVEVQTPVGRARVKVKEIGGKVVDATPEYEDCRRISLDTGIDLRDVMRMVSEAGRKELGLT